VLICYDSEFPLLARGLDCDLLLIPSCTEARTGLSRVELAARARALEGRRYTLLATLTGGVPGCELIDANRGRAGIYAPPDRGLPEDGIVARGGADLPGWVLADLDPAALARLKREGEVDLPGHWPEQEQAANRIPNRGVVTMKP
jgi:predicted amidohydrolase